jgi:ribonuclease VapC
MVIDTSALFAIEFHEPERQVFGRTIMEAHIRLMSAATAVEFVTAFAERVSGVDAMGTLDALAARFEIQIVDVDHAQWREAAGALLRFGRGRHPARLNFGDSFAYALAKVTGEPLLYKGGDFTLTDIVAAI